MDILDTKTYRIRNTSVRMVAHSITEEGNELYTMEWVYPRIIHSEVLRHSMLSHSVSSSRAIPTNKVELGQVYAPATWGKNRNGMSSREEVADVATMEVLWTGASDSAFGAATELTNAGLHKQWTNRITEPFTYIKDLVTTTEIDNFLYLRMDEGAQPEIIELAALVDECIGSSEPRKISAEDYHLPYINASNTGKKGKMVYHCGDRELIDIQEAIEVSMSLAAQTSFRNFDTSREATHRIINKLLNDKPVHASPSEHIAFPMNSEEWHTRLDLRVQMNRFYAHNDMDMFIKNRIADQILFAKNFRGWNQYRCVVDGETYYS